VIWIIGPELLPQSIQPLDGDVSLRGPGESRNANAKGPSQEMAEVFAWECLQYDHLNEWQVPGALGHKWRVGC
jgi:hypothetical protein